ncbi:MAG: hypothetical protein PWQ37_2110 [Candidatus Petromonas sp.]|nr:hypothetical protein [Candidatus Petromonas sp.]
MIEKFKNFIYDCSDVLLALFIIIVMTGIISWKLSGIITVPLDYKSAAINTVEKEKDDTTYDVHDKLPSEQSYSNETYSQPPEQSKEEIIQIVPIESKDIVVEIPKGTTGVGIAKILKDKGLIEAVGDFINRVEELGLAPKLRFGKFTIKSSSSIDEMIYIITGIKK